MCNAYESKCVEICTEDCLFSDNIFMRKESLIDLLAIFLWYHFLNKLIMKKIILIGSIIMSAGLGFAMPHSLNTEPGTYKPGDAKGFFNRSADKHKHERRREIKEVRCPSHPKRANFRAIY